MRNTGMTSARLSNSDASRMQNSLIRWMDYILFKNLDGKYLTLEDCIAENKKPEAETAEAGKPEEERKRRRTGRREGRRKKTTVYYVIRRNTAEPVHQYVQRTGYGCSNPET